MKLLQKRIWLKKKIHSMELHFIFRQSLFSRALVPILIGTASILSKGRNREPRVCQTFTLVRWTRAGIRKFRCPPKNFLATNTEIYRFKLAVQDFVFITWYFSGDKIPFSCFFVGISWGASIFLICCSLLIIQFFYIDRFVDTWK